MGPDAICVIGQKRAAWPVSGEFRAPEHVVVCLGQCFTYHGFGGPTFLGGKAVTEGYTDGSWKEKGSQSFWLWLWLRLCGSPSLPCLSFPPLTPVSALFSPGL